MQDKDWICYNNTTLWERSKSGHNWIVNEGKHKHNWRNVKMLIFVIITYSYHSWHSSLTWSMIWVFSSIFIFFCEVENMPIYENVQRHWYTLLIGKNSGRSNHGPWFHQKLIAVSYKWCWCVLPIEVFFIPSLKKNLLKNKQ